MRGTVAPPESETSASRHGSRGNLGDLWPPVGRHGGPGSVREGEEPKPDRKVGGVGRLYSTEEASNNADRRVGGGECGGKAAGRREGSWRRMPRTQRRTRHVTEAACLRIGRARSKWPRHPGRV